MSSKFFTNKDENTLYKKIEGIFEHRDVHFFDALVGYFRSSGYFRIRPFLEKVPQIRILVGINVDEIIAKYHSKGLLFQGDLDKTVETVRLNLMEDIQKSSYSRKVEDGIVQFVQDVISEKIVMRAHPTKKLHAKIYIFRPKNFNEHNSGEVISGSSNLTDAGLGTGVNHNYEFNALLRDYEDVKFATDEFDTLWQESVPILPEDVQKVKKNTYINDEFTPFEIYIKFLIEYFGKSVEFDPNSISDLPEGFLRLSYQIDSVNHGFDLLKKHNGFFLSDVVGLGKTVVATLIAKKFFYFNDFPNHISTTLVVTPPAVKTNWEDTIHKFGLKNVEFINNGSLHKIERPEKYDLIIVDEAHKFRNDTAEGYTELQKLCKSKSSRRLEDGSRADKKVILVSATPLNNRPHDIRSLVFLFKDGKEDNTLEVSNLTNYFSEVIQKYQEIKNLPTKQMLKEVAILYEDVRDKVIKPLTIRRTRKDLYEHDEYKKDLDKQGIIFPDVEKPNIVLYELDPALDDLYDFTIKMLSDEIEGLTYHRYQAIKYLTPDKKQYYKNADMASRQLAFIMKTLLVKRLDSSFYAFRESLRRFADATRAMMIMFKNERIIIAPEYEVNKFILEDREEELFQELAEVIDTDPSVRICTPEDFMPGFFEGLEKDHHILQDLHDRWTQVSSDPKFEKFYEYIEEQFFDPERNKEGKLVIFSESKETTEYLTDKLIERGVERIITVDSSNRKEKVPVIAENFDANFNGDKKDDYSIIITTEVLAEGVNLHRANTVVNYDTPWNSTRLMQRVGRVNRIGSTANHVFIYNFYPTSKVESDIELRKKAILKLQSFHSALGEDSQIYSPDEEVVQTFGIFEKDIEDEKDERLEYLMELRRFKQENPEDFRRIQNMPLKARTGRKDLTKPMSTLTFIKNKRRNAFYYINSDKEILELSFIKAAHHFKYTSKTEKSFPLHELHHEQILLAVNDFNDKLQEQLVSGITVDMKQGPNEKRVLQFLSAIEKFDFLSREEHLKLKAAKLAIRIHRFQELQRKLNRLAKEIKKNPVKLTDTADKAFQIINTFPLNLKELEEKPKTVSIKDFSHLAPEIIISESFTK